MIKKPYTHQLDDLNQYTIKAMSNIRPTTPVTTPTIITERENTLLMLVLLNKFT